MSRDKLPEIVHTGAQLVPSGHEIRQELVSLAAVSRREVRKLEERIRAEKAFWVNSAKHSMCHPLCSALRHERTLLVGILSALLQDAREIEADRKSAQS